MKFAYRKIICDGCLGGVKIAVVDELQEVRKVCVLRPRWRLLCRSGGVER